MNTDSKFDQISDDTPLITMGDLKELRSDWEQAVGDFKKAEAQIKRLDAKLKAVEALWPQAAFDRSNVLGPQKVYPQGSMATKTVVEIKKPAKPSKVAIIEEILEGYPDGISGAEMHRVLEGRGIITHMNYVYKVLSNLRDKGAAIQARDKTYRHKKHRNSDFTRPAKKDLFESGGADA